MFVLGRYFYWNRISILNWEVIGDLHKDTKTGSLRKETSILADKFNLIDSVQNVDSSVLCQDNLLGAEVVMDGRPIRGGATYHDIDGQRCAYIDETPFCDLIHRWQRGEFTEDDERRAKIWKGPIVHIGNNEYREWLLKYRMIIPRCTSLRDLLVEINRLVRNVHTQSILLDMLLTHYGFTKRDRSIVRSRVNRCRYPLQVMSPYAYYCLRVFALFIGGAVCDLITSRPTDRIDLEYLFYLPFCNVFSSSDKLHKKLAPLLVKEHQVFLPGTELKQALREVGSVRPDPEEMMARCSPVPPMSKSCRIRDIWIRTGWLYHQS